MRAHSDLVDTQVIDLANCMTHELPHTLNWMGDHRRGKLTPGMLLCVGSDVEVSNPQFRHLDLGTYYAHM